MSTDSILPLSSEDYLRIHAVIRAVLDGDGARTASACMFFSIAGALILERHYHLRAIPTAGAALFSLGGKPATVLTFAKLVRDELASDSSAFHCWLECDGWIVDFMAPMFPDNAAERGLSLRVPSRMLQLPRTNLTDRNGLQRAGGIVLIPNPALTAELIVGMVRHRKVRDMAERCATWFRKPPAAMETPQKSDGDGDHVLLFRTPALEGAW